jgi:hypothetical protein
MDEKTGRFTAEGPALRRKIPVFQERIEEIQKFFSVFYLLETIKKQ